jgi:Arc/MetJ family transcription regulator
MRTNIGIDDRLMTQAIKSGGFKTKKEAVEAALKFFVKTKSQAAMQKMRGRLPWAGDLDAMRRYE